MRGLIVFVCVLASMVFANQVQVSVDAKKTVAEIKAKSILEMAKDLSSDQYRGREAGTFGARIAATYIAKKFRQAGLLPGGNAGSYFRTFKISAGYQISGFFEVFLGKNKIDSFKLKEDYMPIHLVDKKAHVKAPCVLVGYGISAPELNFDEYKFAKVKGKVAIVFSGAPWNRKTREWVKRMPQYKLVDTIEYKAQLAEKNGAVAMVIVDNPIGWRKELKIKERLRVPDTSFPLKTKIPVVHITRKVLSEITLMSLEELRSLAVDIVKEQDPQPLSLSARAIRFSASISGKAEIGRNIIGILPGSHPKLKKEAVVIGAHYDHLGCEHDEIYNGANDNASGTSVVISIANAFTSLAKAPKRTVVFIAFDAEEMGIMGSDYYIGSPALPIKDTVMMINFDMVGRLGKDHIYAVGTRSSPEIHKIHHDVNKHVGLKITNPESYRLGRSDHSSFYYAKVPIMYLFGGLDPDYHSPEDTWEKLLPEKMEKVAKLAFLTAWSVAQRDKRITFVGGAD